MHLLLLPLPCSGKVLLQMAWEELEGAGREEKKLQLLDSLTFTFPISSACK